MVDKRFDSVPMEQTTEILLLRKDLRDLPLVTPKQMSSSEIPNNWIPVSERLPKEEINPITEDFYEYQCTYHAYGVYDVRSYKYGNGHWWHGAGIMDDSVIAWRENPDPYMFEPQESEKHH